VKAAAKPGNEQERLSALRRARLLDTLPEQTFDDFTQLAARIAGTPIALVSLIDEDRQWFKSKVGLDVASTSREVAFCSHAILGKDVFVVSDATADDRFVDNPLVTGSPDIRFYAGAPLVDDSGHALGTLCVIDRVARKLSEEVEADLARLARLVSSHIDMRRLALEALEQQAAAEANAERLRTRTELLDLAQDVIIVTDPGDRIMFFNRGASRTLGFTREEAVGRLAHELLATELPIPREEVSRALAHSGHWEGEIVMVGKDGRRVTVDSRWVMRTHESGKPVAILSISQDVTSRREVERMKNEFVSVVSHELRTPLTSIRGALGLIEGGVMGEVQSEMLEMVSIARANADRLIRLVNDILDLEKMEAGKLELKRTDLVLEGVLRNVISGIQQLADRSQVTLVTEVPSDLVLFADEDRMVQLLTNLVSNAVKFSPKGGKVVVRASRRGPRMVRIAVTDQGPGIAPDQIGRLFAKFQQLDAADDRKRGGTGLGLAISKAIAEQHGGSVGVESAVGRGSTFHVDLPAQMPSGRTPAVVARRLALLVDPRGVLSEKLGRILTEEGCLFARTKDVEEAERWLENAQPAIIIVDVDLDGESSGGILERLAVRYEKGDAPTILLTGHTHGAGLARPVPMQWIADPSDEARLRQILRWGSRAPGPARVLLVEDDEQFRAITAARLRALGVDVREAASGPEALELVRDSKPDLIVLDVGLPGFDGFEVVDGLRNERGGLLPLLVYTARDLHSEDRRALTLGLTRWLTKARTSEADFLSAVRELLDGLVKS
jgi:PAS domain S-box-containing protein